MTYKQAADIIARLLKCNTAICSRCFGEGCSKYRYDATAIETNDAYRTAIKALYKLMRLEDDGR